MATQQTFAALLGISQPAVAKLIRKGVLTRGAPIAQWFVEYGKHHATLAAGWSSKDGTIDRIEEAALLDRTKREEIQMRVDEKRGTLIPDVFIEGIGETFTAVKALLLSIPSRVRSRLPHLTADDVDALEDEIRDTLTELGYDRFPKAIRDRLKTGLKRSWASVIRFSRQSHSRRRSCKFLLENLLDQLIGCRARSSEWGGTTDELLTQPDRICSWSRSEP